MYRPEAVDRGDRFRIAAWSTVAAALIGVLLRIVRLDADPYYYAWVGYITDEGRWVETARSLVLYGDPSTYGFNLHFWVAPLFQLSHVPVFALFGVSFWSSRLIASLAGSGLLAWLAFRLRGRVSHPALFLGIALLAAQADLVMLSRVATPETAAMLAQAVVFVTLVLGIDERRKIVGAALLTLAALCVKVTLLPMVLTFALVVVMLPRSREVANAPARRLADGAIYVGVIVVPAAVGIVVALLSGRTAWLDQLANMPTIDSQLGAASVRALVSYPFEAMLSPVFNVLALAAWIGGLVWWTPARASVGIVPKRLFSGAVVWSLGWMVPMLLLGYFPHRYQVHVLVPLALMAVFSAEALGAVGIQRFRESLASLPGSSRTVAALVASLPVGAIAAPLAIVAASGIGADPERVRSKLLAVLVVWAILASVAWSMPRAKTLWTFLLTFPFAFAGCWTVSAATGLDGSFWPAPGEVSLDKTWVLVAAAALGVWVAVFLATRASTAAITKPATLVVGWVFLLASVVSIAPGYLAPTYSMRETSRELGRMLAGADSVTSIASDALFLENELPYRSHFRFASASDKAQYVVFFDAQLHRGRLRRTVYTSYTHMRTFRVDISPAFRRLVPKRDGSIDPFVAIVVSRLKDGPEDTPNVP